MGGRGGSGGWGDSGEDARVGDDGQPEVSVHGIEIGRASCRERVSSPV